MNLFDLRQVTSWNLRVIAISIRFHCNDLCVWHDSVKPTTLPFYDSDTNLRRISIPHLNNAVRKDTRVFLTSAIREG